MVAAAVVSDLRRGFKSTFSLGRVVTDYLGVSLKVFYYVGGFVSFVLPSVAARYRAPLALRESKVAGGWSVSGVGCRWNWL